MLEFVVQGRLFSEASYPPFRVVARDEASARKLAKRDWLQIDSVAPYQKTDGSEEPPLLKFGPPLMDPSRDDRRELPPPRSEGTVDWALKIVISCVALCFGVLIWWRNDDSHS